MNKNAVKLVDLLAGKYGSRNVTKKEIVATAEENGIPYPSWLFYNKSLRVSRGVYKIPGSGSATPTQQTATAAMQPNLKVVSNLAAETNGFSENLVPEKDSLFVPF